MDRIERVNSGWRRCGDRRCAFIRRFAALVLAVGSLAAPAMAQLPCSYTVTVLPNAPCFNFQSPGIPTAINNQGQVLLFASQCFEAYNDTYIWSGGPTLTLIPRPAGMLGFTGRDINDNGLICGQAQYASPSGPRAVVYDTSNGQWTILPPLNPPQGWSDALAINNSNVVCGYRSIGSKGDPGNPRTGFKWSLATGFVDLGTINGESTSAVDIADDGAIAIIRGSGSGGYRWTDAGLESMGFLEGADSIGPSAIASGGRIAGGALFIQGSSFWGVALDFNQNILSPLPAPDADHGSCTTLDINSTGLILGRCQAISQAGIPPGPWRPYIWQAGLAIDLHSLLPPSSNIVLRSAPAFNSHGVIVSEIQGSDFVVVLSPLPRMIGDTNCDRIVNHQDLLAVIGAWGSQQYSTDLDSDGTVNINDLLVVINNWTL